MDATCLIVMFGVEAVDVTLSRNWIVLTSGVDASDANFSELTLTFGKTFDVEAVDATLSISRNGVALTSDVEALDTTFSELTLTFGVEAMDTTRLTLTFGVEAVDATLSRNGIELTPGVDALESTVLERNELELTGWNGTKGLADWEGTKGIVQAEREDENCVHQCFAGGGHSSDGMTPNFKHTVLMVNYLSP